MFSSSLRATRWSLLALLALLAGCSSAPGATTVPIELTPAPLPHPRTFVWTREAETAPPITHVLDEQGQVVGELNGVHIAAGGTEWTWQESTETVPTVPCDQDTEQPARGGRATRVHLVPSDSVHAPLALVVPPAGEDANEIDHSARLVASVGPYLFVEESTYAYTCGAHGNTGVTFEVWNVEDAGTIDLIAELNDRDRIVAAGKSLIDADPDAADFSEDDEPAAVTELFPHLGRNGDLEGTALVSVPSCYACTSGGWGSYSTSTPVEVELPQRLRKTGPVPRAVTVFAARHPDLSVGGYSVSDR